MRTRPAWVAVSLWTLALGACAEPSSQPLTAPSVSEIDAMREEARALWRVQQDLAWQEWTQAVPVNLSETYRGHERLLSRDGVQRLLAAMNEATNPEFKRALRYLRRHVLWEVVQYETADAQDALDNTRRTELVRTSAGSFVFSQLTGKQAKEKDPALRREMQSAAGESFARLADAQLRIDREIKALPAGLGFSSYIELANELRAADLAEVGRVAEKFLDDTDSFYIQAVKPVVQHEMGLDFSKMHLSDVPRFLFSPTYDAYFTRDTVLQAQAVTLANLGLPLVAGPTLKLDLDDRPGKTRRAKTFPVDVPNDVRVSYVPTDGLRAYEAWFHEAGHALAYTKTKARSFELAALGDQTVAYGYGYLLQSLLGSPEWLKTRMSRIPAETREALVKYQAAKRFFMARRYAAKVMFEVAWHSGQAVDLPQLYQNLMSRAHGFRIDEVDGKRWLMDQEPFFVSAQYFRAFLLAAHLEQFMIDRFGDQWFDKPDSGQMLLPLLQKGLEPSLEEVVALLGAQQVDAGALAAIVKKRL